MAIEVKETKNGKMIKRLSFSDLFLSAIGSTIGAGVFVLLPIGINIAGLGIILSLMLAAVITLMVAYNYGELAAALPFEGGGYSWVAQAFGKESSSFIVGWMVWLGNVGYTAFSSLGFAFYASILFNIPNSIIFALLAILTFLILNVIAMKTSIGIEKVLTLGILAFFVILWIYLGASFGPDNLGYMLSRVKHISTYKIITILQASSLLYVLFIGFEAISAIAGEAKKSTELPKAFIYCIIVVTFVYMMTSVSILGALHPTKVKEDSIIAISGPLMPLVMLAAIFATLTSMNAGLIAASRNLYALSRDGMVPKFLSKISRDFHTPFIAVIISGFLAASFILTNAVEYVASIADFGYLVCISMVCSSVILLRITEPKLERPYKVPLYPYISILGTILPLILLMFLDEAAIYTGLVWILIGFFVYNFYKIIKKEIAKEDIDFSDIIRSIRGKRSKPKKRKSKSKRKTKK